ncbi:MAG TPA: hypothetical protein PLL33_05825 [Paracoccus sp. (in: a-proteobacteria)]|nr:hypothetical protein [Paracoccus sp. (in: a-proteobacteria)]
MLFVVATMVVSTLVGGVAGGIAGMLVYGDPAALAFPLVATMGAGSVIPVLLVVWLIPSAFLFAAVMLMIGARLPRSVAAERAGLATAVVAALAGICLLTQGLRNKDVWAR